MRSTNGFDRLAKQFADLASRLADAERRIENGVRFGKISDVDAAKQRARVRIGGTADKPVKSAWLKYSQHAGALKIHSPPSVGQLAMVVAQSGDLEQGAVFPLAFSDDNPSPSQSPDEHVITFGQVRITLKADSLKASIADEIEVEAKAGEYVRGKRGEQRFVASGEQSKIRAGGAYVIARKTPPAVIVSHAPVVGDDPESHL